MRSVCSAMSAAMAASLRVLPAQTIPTPGMSSTRGSGSILLRVTPFELTCSRSEEHTSELQSRGHLVCRLLLEKKKNNTIIHKLNQLFTINVTKTDIKIKND